MHWNDIDIHIVGNAKCIFSIRNNKCLEGHGLKKKEEINISVKKSKLCINVYDTFLCIFNVILILTKILCYTDMKSFKENNYATGAYFALLTEI